MMLTDTSVNTAGRPLQIISFAEKEKDNGKWYEQNCNYIISRSRFKVSKSLTEGSERNLELLYGVYNNKFPMDWFKHVTDPLSASNPNHKIFPAKVRPVSILRPNLDLLMGEYPRRPFVYQVNNLSDSGYSSYQESLNKQIETSLQQRFELQLQQDLMAQGLLTENGQPVSEEAAQQVQEALANMELPDSIKEKFHASYKDKIAMQGQTWLRRALQEYEIKQKFAKNFKHWVIVGESYSYKTVSNGELLYEVVSPLDIDYVKSSEKDFVEDAEQVVRRIRMTLSDVVDRYYNELKKQDLETLSLKNALTTPDHFRTHLYSEYNSDYINVYHTTWKGQKEILFVYNMETDEEYKVDADYPVDKDIEKVIDRIWVNELYECTKISEDLFIEKRPILFQRNAMNNFSTCKQPYNGRLFSNLHAENISPMEMGMPNQIMYIITTRTLELTLAKSKGKILLIDQNAIPDNEDWDEEKFFYYAEALGYGLLNRNQIGVDKSFNQYQVLDMTLFDSIKQLIELQQHFKQEWDDTIGVNRQRKGQTYASDAVGNNERATFQSTVMTDTIFNLFEEFTEKELQGILDLSKFINVDGVKKVWNETDLGNQVLEIEPDEYCNADLGIFVQSSSEALQVLKGLQADAQAMLQNGAKPSTIVEVRRAQNVAELVTKLKHIEDLQAKAEQAMAQNEQEAAAAADERQKQFAEYQNMLDTMFMNKEYDRKEDIEMIRAEANLYSFKAADEATPNGIPDIQEMEANRLERRKHDDGIQQQNLDRAAKMQSESEARKLKREELASKEKIARNKPKPKSK